MSTRTLWIIVILVIIVVGGWYLISQNTASPSPSGQTQTTSGGSDYTPGGPTGSGMETGTVTGNESSSTNTQGYDAMVDWSTSGFNPTTITIKKGQTVRFMNNDTSASFWPASDIHPTHSLYPQKSASDCLGSSFDACKALGPGQYFDFTFSYAGKWGCHNHLRASQKCTIVVQ